MLIRYHLFFYAVFGLLLVLSLVFHPLFFIVLFLYTFYLFKRFRWSCLPLVIVITILICLPKNSAAVDTTIHGEVVDIKKGAYIVQTSTSKIKLYYDQSLDYGDEITCNIILLEMNHATNDNAFDEEIYLKSQGIKVKGKITYLKQRIPHQSFSNILLSLMDKDEVIRSYQKLFLMGIRDELMDEHFVAMSELSIIHLFALSGMHIHVLYQFVFRKLSIIISKEKASWITICLIGFYVYAIPYNISLMRAFYMLLLPRLLHHYFNKLDCLSALVLFQLFKNPYIIYNTSFVFSYFVFFLVLISEQLPYRSFFLYCSTIPIVLNSQYTINLLSFALTSVLTPFIEYFYLITLLSFLCPMLLPIMQVSIYLFESILLLTSDASRWITFSKPTLEFIILYYYIFFMTIISLQRKKSVQKYVCLGLSLLIAFYGYSHYKIYGEVTTIDVGQGDCTFIRLPLNQGNILIDTGGNREYDLATNVLIPYFKSIGVDHIDYVYISHSDYDHCGALSSLKEHFPIYKVIDYYEEYRKIGPLEITMLKSDATYLDTNNQSLVMIVNNANMKYLFTGDISEEVEKDLYNKYVSLDIDVLKVSHHGSQTASSPLLFEMIHPIIGMIGVKKNNMYHHPSPVVIERLKKRNMCILRTDQDGMFTIRNYGKEHYIFR